MVLVLLVAYLFAVCSVHTKVGLWIFYVAVMKMNEHVVAFGIGIYLN